MPITLIDESTRPKAPKIEGVTDTQRQHGRRLAMIHRYHLQEMARVRSVLEQVGAGTTQAEEAGKAAASLEMLTNMRQFGALCGRECDNLNAHHSIEEYSLFPELEGHSEGLTRVVQRLREEHLVIHALLEQMEEAALKVLQMPGPSSFAKLREVFETLEPIVRSHFGYEQTELEEALGVYAPDL
jgi:hypothetical protein